VKLVGLSGSLREASFNTALLRAAARVAPADVEFVVETVRGIPLYDADVEAAEGVPQRVSELKDLIAEAGGLILATPEYNNAMPGVFKNALDWLSRPPEDSRRVFGGKPVAVIGATPGGFGTVLAQGSWLPVLRTLGTAPWFGGRLMVAHAGKVFDGDGNLEAGGTVEEQLRAFVAGFAKAAAQAASAP
jgi:chromate reductase, NAD(P)H dehydrogenase (quinone)